MTYTTIEIKSYRLALFSHGAKVSLYDAQGGQFGAAYIRPESEPLKENYQDADGIYRVYFHYSRLPALVDLLRNESPVYLHYWHEGGLNCHLASGLEPVGEGE
ncbi:MAG: hypothetical protein AB7I38_10770 [Dehalococcoidia bacterium]